MRTDDLLAVVAEGHWCQECEYFEDPAPFEDGECKSCGCTTGQHVPVRVIQVDAIEEEDGVTIVLDTQVHDSSGEVHQHLWASNVAQAITTDFCTACGVHRKEVEEG